MSELEKIIHAILHALHLDHGIPSEVVDAAKTAASTAIKAAIAAEIPPAFVPVLNVAVDGMLAAEAEADPSLSPDAPMVQV